MQRRSLLRLLALSGSAGLRPAAAQQSGASSDYVTAWPMEAACWKQGDENFEWAELLHSIAPRESRLE